MLAPLAGLLFALQPAPRDPPYFYCEVTRPVPYGNVTVLQYVATAGPSDPPVTTWFAERGNGGTILLAAWDSPAEMADRAQGGEILFGYQPADRSLRYRVEVAAVGAPADRTLRSELQLPSRNGIVSLRTRWAPVVTLLAGFTALEIRVLDAEGAILRRDRVDAAEFGRSLRIAGEIQPEFAAMIANYRERCHPTDSNGH